MKIGNINLKTNLILPAIAGFSDAGMRKLCLRFGAALAFTEMVSAKGLLYENKNTKELLVTSADEEIKCAQLFGSEPEIIAKAVRDDLTEFDIIDLNFGCPMPKIIKNGDGGAVLKTPSRIYEIVKASKRAAEGKEITVKIRAGFTKDTINAVENAKAAEDGGASAVTLHGRTVDMLYSGKADWEIIGKVKQAVKIPVIGNGDITDCQSLHNMLSLTNADGAAIARAAIGRPYIFAELSGQNPVYDVNSLISEHIAELLKFFPSHLVAANMKKHIAAYLKHSRGSKKLKNAVFAAKGLNEIIAFFKD